MITILGKFEMAKRTPPLFMVVRKELESWIKEKNYRPGNKLPSEQELSEIFKVSRVTVREALRTMEEDGIVVRSQGKGTFLAERRIASILEANIGVTEMIETMGYKSGTLSKKIKRQKANLFLADKLKIEKDSKVIIMERIRTADDQPVAYTIDVIPWWIFSLKALSVKEFERYESIYTFLEERCGQIIKDSTARLSAVTCPDIAEKLNLQKDTALFVIEQVDTDQNEQPIVYSREYFVGRFFEFKVRRRRTPGFFMEKSKISGTGKGKEEDKKTNTS
ncbi:hypothetical protein DRJ04_03475 [Candidatus Aerophobetes bacterium]|uniref:HTH gntR-type domain-containing protein n=1 Tax=Aerophobetes bacterium TaxID=2030807 RepID=A0A662DIB7_UNCAE|nr:MAG: hypothetical protein DRJ04_03475 [Candidatus Aerophobetes bacterium]